VNTSTFKGRSYRAEARRVAAIKALTFKHEDTALGAWACLMSLADAQTRAEFNGAGFKRDPVHQGVWAADGEHRQRAIIYLAGYPDAFGRTRTINDFEIGTY
jgi:hypothetical protein